MSQRNHDRIALAGALCLALLGCQTLAGNPATRDDSEVIAEVGGEQITLHQ